MWFNPVDSGFRLNVNDRVGCLSRSAWHSDTELLGQPVGICQGPLFPFCSGSVWLHLSLSFQSSGPSGVYIRIISKFLGPFPPLVYSFQVCGPRPLPQCDCFSKRVAPLRTIAIGKWKTLWCKDTERFWAHELDKIFKFNCVWQVRLILVLAYLCICYSFICLSSYNL